MDPTYTREQLEDLKVKWDRMAKTLKSEVEFADGVKVDYEVSHRTVQDSSELTVMVRVTGAGMDFARGSLVLYADSKGPKGRSQLTATSSGGSSDSRRLQEILWEDALRYFLRLANSVGSSRVA